MYLFELFSFVPLFAFTVLAARNIKPDEYRAPLTGRLAISSGLVFLAALLQIYEYHCVHPSGPYHLNGLILSSLSTLYFTAFLVLEDAVYLRRIRESFYQEEYRRRLQKTAVILLCLFLTIAALLAESLLFQTSYVTLHSLRLTLFLFSLLYLGLHLYGLTELFSFRRGTIRRNYYLLTGTITIHTLLVLPLLFSDGLTAPLLFSLFIGANILYMCRIYGAFFSDTYTEMHGKILQQEQQFSQQNGLIRQIINSPEEEDLDLLHDTVEEAVDQSRNWLVNPDYGITGITIYTRKGNLLKLESTKLILGFCAPLVRNMSLKNMSRRQVNEAIFRQSFNLEEIENQEQQDITDPASQILKTLLTEREPFMLDPLPSHLKGLHRMVAFTPVFDKKNLLALLAVFKDNFDKIYPTEERELKTLADNLGVILMIRRGKAQIREQNRLQGEMEIAQRLQSAIVPREIPLPGYETAASMTPATEVGGDIYDYKSLGGDHYLAIGDVSGHGLPAGITAALQMAAFHGVLEGTEIGSLSKEGPPGDKDSSLARIYDAVNRVLCTINRDRIGSDKFMTLNYLREKNGTFLHAGAHEIGLIYRSAADTVEEHQQMANGTGFMGISEYLVSSQSLGRFSLNPGDILLLYSDGLIEAANSQGELFGIDRLKEVLRRKSTSPAGDILREIQETLRHFLHPAGTSKEMPIMSDDITLVILKKNPTQGKKSGLSPV